MRAAAIRSRRNAVQEFRVITNNYKAEYQKASSAIITAVTKSGGNTWEGSTFFDYQNKDLVSIDTFAAHAHATDPNYVKPDYSRYLFGASAGGPLIKDKLFFFGTYEGNFQSRLGTVHPDGNPANFPSAISSFDLSDHNSPFHRESRVRQAHLQHERQAAARVHGESPQGIRHA